MADTRWQMYKDGVLLGEAASKEGLKRKYIPAGTPLLGGWGSRDSDLYITPLGNFEIKRKK